MTTADPLTWARPRLADLVNSAERRSGSRMAAYDHVARAIDRSPRWLRRVLGRAADVELSGHDVFRIASAYRALCERIETEAENQRRIAAALRRQDDEAFASFEGALGRLDGSARGGAATASESEAVTRAPRT